MVALAPAEDIHEHLVRHLNNVLCRPGMYGPRATGESHARTLIELILVAEQRPDLLAEQMTRWRERGVFLPTGVTGAFSLQLPAAHDKGAMTVYAEFAREGGWLRTDRLLDDGEYRALRDAIPQFVAQDRTRPDVLAAFGPPSLPTGTNPRWPMTHPYVPADPAEPIVTFHLWNEYHSELEQPVLLAVHVGGDEPFPEQFSFTPEGRRRRPPTAVSAR
jgi:hypothetical protein